MARVRSEERDAWAHLLDAMPGDAAVVDVEGVVVAASDGIAVGSNIAAFSEVGYKWDRRLLSGPHTLWLATKRSIKPSSELIISDIADSTSTLLIVTDIEGKVQDANEAARRFFGPTLVEQADVSAVIGTPPRPDVMQDLATKGRASPKHVMRRADGSDRQMQWHLTWDPIFGHAYALGFDLTASAETDEMVRDAERFFALTSDMLVVIGLDGPVRWNKAAETHLGLSESSKHAGFLIDLIEPEDVETAEAAVYEAMDAGISSNTSRVRRPNGEIMWIQSTLVFDQTDQMILLVAREVTYERELVETMRVRAETDALTGLASRLSILERLEVWATEGAVALLFCDFDRFKVINDSLGHWAGDELIRQMAQRLRCLAESEGHLVGRIGGDEFVCLVRTGRRFDAQMVADQILDLCNEPFSIGDHVVALDLSIGISIASNTRSIGAAQMLTEADTALYRAKDMGGSCSVTFDDHMRDRAQSRFTTETQLRSALVGDSVFMQYQPIVSLTDGAIRAAEALVRVRAEHVGVIGPAEFLDVAAEVGLLSELGRRVLSLVMADFRSFDAPFRVGLNVSPPELIDRRYATRILEACEATDFDPELLTIELTETSLITDLRGVRANLELLRANGVRVALDDFGTGFSSMAHLRELPIDCVKIDASFAPELLLDGSTRAVAAGIIHLCGELGLRVIAEGIETHDQFEAFRELGCNSGQGYYFYRPLGFPDFSSVYRASLSPTAEAADEVMFDLTM